MRSSNEYLATRPFDLYELHVFHLVVKHRSFTRAAEVAGLTQSAVTRQVQVMERSLGIDLLERTTRSVRLTTAGRFLHEQSVRLLGDVDATLLRLQQDHGVARRQVRVGVSQTVGLAYLPGFFHANLRKLPEVATRVSVMGSTAIITALQGNELDLGVISRTPSLPPGLEVTHRFDDMFTFIAPADGPVNTPLKLSAREGARWAAAGSWMLPGESSYTGRQLRRWLKSLGWDVAPVMEFDNFDLIINLVALGMGVSCVPVRALALYAHKRGLRRISLHKRFTRELVVVSRRRRSLPPHVCDFIENILF